MMDSNFKKEKKTVFLSPAVSLLTSHGVVVVVVFAIEGHPTLVTGSNVPFHLTSDLPL